MKAFMYDVVNMIVDRADDESATIRKQIPKTNYWKKMRFYWMLCDGIYGGE